MSQMKRVLTCSRLNVISLEFIDSATLARLPKSISVLRMFPKNRSIHQCFSQSSQPNNLIQNSDLSGKHQVIVRVIFSRKPSSIFGKNFGSSNFMKNEKQVNKSDLVESHTEGPRAVSTSVMHSVKETSKTAISTVVIIIGLMATLSIIYAVVSELFSGNSAHRIYSKAFAYVSKDSRIQNVMGDQIKGYGEETRRGRRQHVSHVEYMKDGRLHLRMKFYIKGTRGNGSVHLEMIENDQGQYEYRYLFVVVESDSRYSQKTIILEDNRSKFSNDGKIASSFNEERGLLDNSISPAELDLSSLK